MRTATKVGRVRGGLLAGVLLLPGGLLVLPSAAQAASGDCAQSGLTMTCTYTYTGAEQTFTVPGGVSSIGASVDGAMGGGGFNGARGGRADATIPVEPGVVLTVVVGGMGGAIGPKDLPGGGGFGFGHGGDGGKAGVPSFDPAGDPSGAGGGGGSALLEGADVLLVAGGGGGSAGRRNYEGGAGGGTAGEDAPSAGDRFGTASGGRGGTQSGAAGQQGGSRNGGTGGSGDADSINSGPGGGGGGGGWFGGGGGQAAVFGNAAGGGGGSGYASPLLLDAVLTSGARSGHGLVQLSYSVPLSPTSLDPVSGSGQSVRVGQAFADPLVAKVTDSAAGLPVPGQPVTFTVTSGSASFPGGSSTSEPVLTDEDGQATSPVLTAGPTAGPVTVSATSSTVTGTATFSGTVTAPVVASIADLSEDEGNTGGTRPFTFTVTLDRAVDQPVSVEYATANGTATAATEGDREDYRATSGTLTIPAGQTSGTIPVLVTAGYMTEPDESFAVQLSNPSAGLAVPAATATATGTIRNDDPQPKVRVLDAAITEADRGTRALRLPVRLGRPSSTDVTVTYRTAPGTAVSPGDFTNTSGTLRFTPGSTLRYVNVQTNGDRRTEPDETFTITLTNPTGGTVGRATATGTLRNND